MIDKETKTSYKDIREIKKTLRINNADIGYMFGYASQLSYNSSSRKPDIEKGIQTLFEIFISMRGGLHMPLFSELYDNHPKTVQSFIDNPYVIIKDLTIKQLMKAARDYDKENRDIDDVITDGRSIFISYTGSNSYEHLCGSYDLESFINSR